MAGIGPLYGPLKRKRRPKAPPIAYVTSRGLMPCSKHPGNRFSTSKQSTG